MSYDVVVVGGGIGGLTVAALLAVRGMSVCLLERQSAVGGCVSRVQFDGLEFEPGMGIYTGWQPGEIHQRIFSELKIDPPETNALDEELVVRITGETDVTLYRNNEDFYSELRRVFPECIEAAVAFYEEARQNTAGNIASDLNRGGFGAIRSIRNWLKPDATKQEQALEYRLRTTSARFRSFIDAQLHAFANSSVERSGFSIAGRILQLPRNPLYTLQGGPAAVAEKLATSLINSGGKLRLDTPVLRLAYDQTGAAVGVDLLSGETVRARRAIVSNMTVWDTYGKLIGINRTPADVKKTLNTLQSDGVFIIYATMEESAVHRLPSLLMMVVPSNKSDDDGPLEFTLCATGSSSQAKRAVTIKTRTNVNEWFRYQSSEADYEEWDQQGLERLWESLHTALPELGADIEIVETANPRTFYEQTRRKLGMVLGLGSLQRAFTQSRFQTILPNVFMVGDTVSVSPTMASVNESGLAVADLLTQ